MVVGRDAELATLKRLAAGARGGAGGAIVVAGGAGLGKTALLRELAAAAGGLDRHEARGVASEAELPFAGLLDLVRSLLPWAAALPEAQRAALEAALAVGPPSSGDRFAVCAASG